VSVTESDIQDLPPEDWGDGPAAYEPGHAPIDGRTPPQDMAAEQSVLGAMMISKDAIADVVESVRGPDYYRPAHEAIHDAIVDLYSRGEPADMVTVADELARRGELQRIGGAPYLHTLSANVPIAANAGYYAEIVHEKAVLRRLIDAGTKVVQIGNRGEGEVAVDVEVADSDDERAAGLMNRESLPEDAGMIFVFPEDHSGGFWMKDTLIPLSIAFADADGRILRILDMTPCEVDPCRIYDPAVSYRSALEV
jgi:uncharacterized membrane protein (UPF0127 family)